MRVSNQTTDGNPSEPFAELLRMQTDFQARLADETFRYLRRLHGTLGPGAPGTVVSARQGLTLEGRGVAGGRIELTVEIHNVQRVHCIVSPQLTPLVGRSGTTWFPATSSPHHTLLVAPDANERVVVLLDVPEGLPDDEYAGALLLQGFRDGAIAVRVRIGAPAPAPSTVGRRKAKRKKATAKRSGRNRA